MDVIKKIPTAEELIQEFPLSAKNLKQILKDRKEVQDIINGKDPRKLIIVGPCSAWPSKAVITYGKKLVQLKSQMADRLKIVMRVYVQKPRTTKGWTGPINQPNPLKDPDIEIGLKYVRSMMIELIELGLSIADEMLFINNGRAFLELLSWIAIGARSAEDQEHRIFASALECAVGMKNPTSGNLEIAVNNVIAAQHPHSTVMHGEQVSTYGNPYAHIVLRGGQKGPNYHYSDLLIVKELMDQNKIVNPSVIIDASHDNCLINHQKNAKNQIIVVEEVLDYLEGKANLEFLKGFMIESFLKSGNQKVASDMSISDIDLDGLSITDPCLGFEDTENLLEKIYNKCIC